MLQTEWQALTDHNPTLDEWTVINAVYTWHDAIPDVNGKQVLADIYAAGGLIAIEKMSFDLPDEHKPTYTVDNPYETYEVRGTRNTGGMVIAGSTKAKPLSSVYEYLLGKIREYDQEHYPDAVAHEWYNPACGGLIDEYFHSQEKWLDMKEWPLNHRWIACYAVTGDSEGHYIHVDAIMPDGTRKMLFLAKTFKGKAHACLIANLFTEWLTV